MTSTIYLSNGLSVDLSASTQIAQALSGKYWSEPNGAIQVPSGGDQTALYWINGGEGITDHETRTITTTLMVGNSTVLLQVQLLGTLIGSDVGVQIVAGDGSTGWQAANAQMKFTAADGNVYRVSAACSAGLSGDIVFPSANCPPRSCRRSSTSSC
jgi:hypothetical protein